MKNPYLPFWVEACKKAGLSAKAAIILFRKGMTSDANYISTWSREMNEEEIDRYINKNYPDMDITNLSIVEKGEVIASEEFMGRVIYDEDFKDMILIRWESTN